MMNITKSSFVVKINTGFGVAFDQKQFVLSLKVKSS